MKTLFIILIFFNSFIFAQSDCKDFKSLLKIVNKDYAELSQLAFPNYVKYTLSQKDSIKISLYNVKGEMVYKEKFGLLEANTYIIKFFNPKCTGVYFTSIEIGNQPSYKKSIQITSEECTPNEHEIDSNNSTTILEGAWKRSYSDKLIPPIQPQVEDYKLEYHYKYDLTVTFSNNDYKILSIRTDKDNGGKETKIYEGKYIATDDTLKLYEESKVEKVFQYKVVNDTLSLTHFITIDKKTGITSIPMQRSDYTLELNLIGKYHK